MVIDNKKVKRSGRALSQALEDQGYDGLPINWGNSTAWCNRLDQAVINKPEAVAKAANKRVALHILRDNNVPVALVDDPTSHFPVVGRPDYHSQGRWLRYIEDQHQLQRDLRINKRHPTTHYQQFVSTAREFRVHIVNSESIKISEKISPDQDARVKNHRFGAKCVYPWDFEHKKTLRRIAREAVAALGLDFGAVDLLYKGGEYFVLEVNTAPCLTDPHSDTLERYVAAFQRWVE